MTTYARLAEAELAAGDLAAARRWVDDAVGSTSGRHHVVSLITRARVAMAQDQPDQASRDAHAALAVAVEIGAAAGVPEILECLAELAGDHREAARLCGPAESMRGHVGTVRFQVHQAGYEASVAALREAMGETDFDAAWGAGTPDPHLHRARPQFPDSVDPGGWTPGAMRGRCIAGVT
ncbi:hypothetical protein ACNO8X_03050 [Mycobacterium sp. PDNC021]|uniref:hypothetical protein n=1 Tax=Mycobacterium sp. PDNC021 TaxID=3391399 RepID=UPI003AAAED41